MTTERTKLLLELAATLDDDEKDWLAKALKVDDYEKAFEEIHQRVWRPYYKHGYGGKLDDIIERSDQIGGERDNMGEYKNDVLDAIEILHDIYIDILEDNNINVP
ncbi:hypothetical protein GCM10007916_00350 [Psychromonas marina]|uniref:Uncharacterized protein n=1 Tax=Psychromonas marina TaxID=88364 RepID=A0ABQ6DV28_9GAMM|nr:hypothetical protein [Psychromonas marina]GLS88968.1 hypothetical protein GCM10007916_00350 [Psychromonas marina]